MSGRAIAIREVMMAEKSARSGELGQTIASQYDHLITWKFVSRVKTYEKEEDLEKYDMKIVQTKHRCTCLNHH